MTETLLLGTAVRAVHTLAEGLGADVVELPTSPDDAALEAWRADVVAGPPVGRVVVAAWITEPTPGRADALDLATWTARAERPLAAWVAAAGAAAARVADGGSVVLVVERPSPLDCYGWAPESAIADAVEALARSLGRSEGPRGVRVNAVGTPARLTGSDVVAPPPPLASFPGTIEREVVGAVRLLLDDDAVGLTGAVAFADSGRSWR